MDSNKLNSDRIEHAREQVKKIKGFYTHVLVFILVNLFIVFINIQNLEAGESYFQVHNFITFGIWGIAILFHGLSVFLPNFIFGSKWEERKIHKFMQEEEKQQQWD